MLDRMQLASPAPINRAYSHRVGVVRPGMARQGVVERRAEVVNFVDRRQGHRPAVLGDRVALPPLRSSAKVSFRCLYHVVWCTQYRMPVLDEAVQERLREIAVEVVEEKGAWLRRFIVRPTYVEMIVEVGPQLGVHRLVKAVKARSAGALRSEFPSLRSRLPSLWTNSYLVTTLGGHAPEEVVRNYIDQQPRR